MKTTMIAMMAAALLAGNLHAQTAAEIEAMTDRVVAACQKNSVINPPELEALIADAKAMAAVDFACGELTDVQELNNELITKLALLLSRKVSDATAVEYAVQKKAWISASRHSMGTPTPEDAITYSGNGVAADPASVVAKLEHMLVRARVGKQNVIAELDALLAANPASLSHWDTKSAFSAWEYSMQLDGQEIPLAAAKEFLVRLEAAAAPAPIVAGVTVNENKLRVKIRALGYRSALGENVNAEIMDLLGDVSGVLRPGVAQDLYESYKPAAATNAEALAFYDALLRALRADAGSARLIRRILDQKLKLQ